MLLVGALLIQLQQPTQRISIAPRHRPSACLDLLCKSAVFPRKVARIKVELGGFGQAGVDARRRLRRVAAVHAIGQLDRARQTAMRRKHPHARHPLAQLRAAYVQRTLSERTLKFVTLQRGSEGHVADGRPVERDGKRPAPRLVDNEQDR
eukprot:2653979-Pleurochrysis_carterae.AAC.1